MNPRVRARSRRKSAFAIFAADAGAVDAATLALRRLGEGFGRQSPERRSRLPGVDWARLEAFRSSDLVRAMTAREIWAFVRDEVPALVEVLR